MRKDRSGPITLFSFQDILTSLMGVVFLIVLLMSLQMIHQIPRVSDLSYQQAAQLQREIQQMEADCQKLQEQLRQRQEEAQRIALGRQELEEQHRQLEQRCQSVEAESQALQHQLVKLQQEQKNLETQLQEAPERKQIKQWEQKLSRLRGQLARLKTDELWIFNPAPGEKIPWLVDLAAPAWRILSVQTGQPVQIFDHSSAERRITSLLTWARSRDRHREYFVLFVRPSALEGSVLYRQNPYYKLRQALEEAGFELGVDLLGENQQLVLGTGSRP
ncbi:MAG: hypothetical protein NZ602_05505 [Thermoguttaceae bacterium]|nr:hypothetical protein [Thermoguttaceae bacterium]MDW8038838.1 hypothetical protein [Thermoguttaceae bacterium]